MMERNNVKDLILTMEMMKTFGTIFPSTLQEFSSSIEATPAAVPAAFAPGEIEARVALGFKALVEANGVKIEPKIIPSVMGRPI